MSRKEEICETARYKPLTGGRLSVSLTDGAPVLPLGW